MYVAPNETRIHHKLFTKLTLDVESGQNYEALSDNRTH